MNRKHICIVVAAMMAMVSCAPKAPQQDSPLDRAMAFADSIGVVRRIAVTSATQVGMLHALGSDDRICAVANGSLYHNLSDSVRAAATELGNDFELNIEQTILTRPDLLLMTDYGFRTQGIEQVTAAGIPVLYLSEWREEDPLRRAEWIRVIGRLTGREELADSLLAVSAAEYERLKSLVENVENRRSLAAGQSYRGTWYVPTGGTYMGKIIADAGADYVYLADSSAQSLPLTIEEAIIRLTDAEIWIGAQAESLDELARIDTRHTWMGAWQTGDVYAWDRAKDSHGGNDFWETGAVRPDYILADLIWALYPDQMGDYEPHFIRKLQ